MDKNFQRINKSDDKEMVVILIMKTLYFLFFKKDITRLKQNTILVLMRLDMKINKCLQIYLSKGNFKNDMELLLIGNKDKNKSHYVWNKDFNRFMFNETKA